MAEQVEGRLASQVEVEGHFGVHADAEVVVEAHRSAGKAEAEVPAGPQLGRPPVQLGARALVDFTEDRWKIYCSVEVRSPVENARQVVSGAERKYGRLRQMLSNNTFIPSIIAFFFS